MLTRSGGVTALSELDDIAGRPVVDRDLVFAISHSGVMAAINAQYRRPGVDARHRRHPDALGGGRLRLCPHRAIAAHVLGAQGRKGEMDSPIAAPDGPDGYYERSRGLVGTGAGIRSSDRRLFRRSCRIDLALYGRDARADGDSRRHLHRAVVANDTLYLLTNDADLGAHCAETCGRPVAIATAKELESVPCRSPSPLSAGPMSANRRCSTSLPAASWRIVHDTPGVTRDRREADASCGDWPFSSSIPPASKKREQGTSSGAHDRTDR